MPRPTRKPSHEAAVAPPDEPDRDPAWVERVRARLAAWYREAHRDLPWRTSRDPYRILVSETMLVQTTVAAVVPFYERFLATFPTLEALAVADEAAVVKAWEGLGYYRRARQLHAAARRVLAEHGGLVPDDPDALAALPGVGRYIAGAVLSFAFDRPAPILEANTQRVVARWLAWPGELTAAATRRRLWEAAARLVPPAGAGEFNQAFMELGALVCTPRMPACLVCPVAAECRARVLGMQDRLPVVAPRPAPLASREACAVVRHDDRFLVLQRGPDRLWHGFWEFPTIHLEGSDPALRSVEQGGDVDLATGVRHLTGVRVRVGPVAQTVRYGVTRHRVTLEVHDAAPIGPPTEPVPAGGFARAAWFDLEELARHAWSAAGRRVLARLRAAT